MLNLDRAAVAKRLTPRALIERLERAFAADYTTPVRQVYDLRNGGPGGSKSFLLMPSWQVGGAIGVKLVTIFADNALRGLPAVSASYLLFDAETGAPRAMLDGAELTVRRTGAASALASKYLSRPDSERLLMVGTGSLAPHLILSHAAGRPIKSVRIWGRRPDKAHEIAAGLAGNGFAIEVCEDLEAGVKWADIVSCATLAQEPLILGRWLRPGQHLDLVGAYLPNMREADDDAVIRSQVYVDTVAAVAEAGELVQPLKSGKIKPEHIRGELSELARGVVPGRSSPDAITLFKSVGTAIEDLAAAELAVEGQ